MKPISRIVLRMYAPAALVPVGGLLLAEMFARSHRLIGSVPAARLASLVFLLAVMVALYLALRASWRLWRWAQGREQRCECGGPLSRPRTDRQGRTWRRCMGCGARV
ncbi:hypothetical protein [Pseudoxanthomonas mexicana]|uniref:hypothetical protein n=1 Tax=Pseudoxanthomonas mexicana TaxID=128785 RepID=UPI00398A5E49